MNERVDRSADERREVIERREVVTGPGDAPPRRTEGPSAREARAATVWLWLIPLLGLVVFLVWFILARGEPQRPFENVDIDLTVPAAEPAPPPQQTAPRIEVPAPDAPAATQPNAPPSEPAPQ